MIGVFNLIHEIPPFVDLSINPLSPAANPVFADGKVTEKRLRSYPLDCCIKFIPELVVYKITPLFPTHQPVVEFTNLTEFKEVVIPELC